MVNNSERLILVAEDDDISFDLLKAFFANMNFNLLHAKNGKEAIDLFNQNPDISLILMDIKMPVVDGIQATEEIRKINRKVPIIAQTAYALSGDREKALEAGCNEYVSKPLIKNVLMEKVNLLLELV